MSKVCLKLSAVLLLVASVAHAWNVARVHKFGLDGHSMSATGLFDLTGDGSAEFLVPGNAWLYCYDSGAALRWSFRPASNYFPAISSALAADLYDDGNLEVVVSTPLTVAVLGPDGTPVWQRTLAGQGAVQNCISSVALADLNRDRRLEVLAYEVYANRLLCLDPGLGETLWTYTPDGNVYFSVGTPTVADLDCDGRLDVLGQVSFTGGGGQLYCLDDTGAKLWSYNTTGSGISGWQLASAAVADVDGDDSLEVVSVANYWGVFCLDCRGDELWTRRISEHTASYPAIADVDNDDTLDVVVAVGPNLRCFNARTGRDKWSFAVASGYYVVSSPAVCDLDGDGLLEVIFAEVKQNNPNDSLRPMWVLDCRGRPLWSDTVGTTMSDPTAGDVDSDGRVEFCIGPTYRGYNWWLFRADTVAVEPGRIDWPTLQHDIWRTGWYGYEGPVVAVEEAHPLNGDRVRLTAQPNPFSSVTRLTLSNFRNRRPGIFDASGRLVRELTSGDDPVWDGRDLHGRSVPAGAYFVRLADMTGPVLRVVKLGK
ncbi:MAG: FG-GAP-like repeat-containing protein [candidate division WOR-3 bacterium]